MSSLDGLEADIIGDLAMEEKQNMISEKVCTIKDPPEQVKEEKPTSGGKRKSIF